MRARSPKIGIPSNGFTPLGPSSAIAAMVRGMGEALVIGDDELATPASARQAFAEAGADVTTAVCVSSAMVYGAWPDNPVPLTEDAAVRPNPGFDVAIQLAEVERIARDWKAAAPGRTLAILRPVTVLGRGEPDVMARVLAGVVPVRVQGDSPPAQYV